MGTFQVGIDGRIVEVSFRMIHVVEIGEVRAGLVEWGV